MQVLLSRASRAVSRKWTAEAFRAGAAGALLHGSHGMTAESSPPARLGPVGPAEDSIEVRSRLGVYAVQGPILDFRASVSQKKFVYGVNVMIGMDDTGG